MRFDFLYDRRRRIFAIGYRLADADGPGRLDRVYLRPARVRSAARQLHRDRQGRRAPAALVPPGTPRDQRRRPRRADLVGRDDVRVPDAAAAHAQLLRHLARSELPRSGAAADRLRTAAARAVGYLRVGLCLHRSGRDLPVPGVRRARARPQARPGHRPRDCAIRHRPGQPGVAGRWPSRTSTGWPRRAWRGVTGSTRRSTTTPAAGATTSRRRSPCLRPSCARTSRTIKGCPWWHWPTWCARTCSCRGSTPIPAFRPRSCLLQERVPREAILSEPRPAETATAPPSLPAFASRRFLTPQSASVHTHFLSNGRYTTAITNAGGGYSMWGDIAVTRRRDDPTSDGGRAVHLPADPWSGLVWSATHHPVCHPPDGSRRPSISTRSRSAAATAPLKPRSTSPCRPRTTSRCGASPSPTAAHRPASSR